MEASTSKISAQQVAEAPLNTTEVPFVSKRNAALGLGLASALGIAFAANYYGVPTDQVLGQRITTENSLTLFSSLAGIGGFLGSIISSHRLSQVEGDTVLVGDLAKPVAVTIIGSVIAVFLFPTSSA